jgi:hypothetical protein
VTDPVEVLAVEIRHYVGDGMKTLVPRVIGQTAEAEVKKKAGASSGVSRKTMKEIMDLFVPSTEPAAAYSVEELARRTGKATGTIKIQISNLVKGIVPEIAPPLKLVKGPDGKYRLEK